MTQQNNDAIKMLKQMAGVREGGANRLAWIVLIPVSFVCVILTRRFDESMQRHKRFHERAVEVLNEKRDRQRLAVYSQQTQFQSIGSPTTE